MQITTPTKTRLMGILNITPDSFSDGGQWFGNVSKAVAHAKQMISQGATIIDVGGESTRPSAEKVSAEEEKKRVVPVIEALKKEVASDILISVDTYKADVAHAAVSVGADMINDVSGLQLDAQMPDVVAATGVPIIINHMRGTPRTMQKGEIVYTDVVKEIIAFFQKQIASLRAKGVSNEKIILDPGFGFGKTVEQNLEILKRLEEFKILGLPILIGVSRKSTFGKILQEELGLSEPVVPSDRLEASLAATAVAVMHGAQIIRTHDILETRKFLTVIERVKN
jgi:dihydropteroate synthase